MRFWNLFRPGCDEHYLVHILRGSDAFIPELDYVAELNGKLAGSILYAHSLILLDAGGELPVITFGPVSVAPRYQRQGIGRALIEHTAALAGQMGYPAVLIFGDPAYYSRVGFLPAKRFGIASSDNEYCAALQARELTPGALQNARGRFAEDPVYHMDPAAAEAFDQTFPPKEAARRYPDPTALPEGHRHAHAAELTKSTNKKKHTI